MVLRKAVMSCGESEIGDHKQLREELSDMITIGEIAQKAGVSKATVSRVVNNSGYVREETRNKIEAIIEEYRYTPSAAAQNLSRQQTNTIGVIVPELENAFFTEVLTGISQILDQEGLTMLMCNTSNNKEKEKEALLTLEQQRVRGVIFTSAGQYSSEEEAQSVQELLRKLNAPVVVVDREIDNIPWDCVYYENFKAGYLAAQRLIKRGKKQLGILLGDLKHQHGRERYEGFCQALKDYGLELNPAFVYHGDYLQEKAYEVTKRALKCKEDCADGLVICNNLMFMGYLKAKAESGWKPGGEPLPIVAIDHIPTLDMIEYPYECVTRDMKEMGREAIRLLLKRFENPDKEREISMIPCEERY